MDNYGFTILTDTASDITTELARRFGVFVLPMNVTVGDRSFAHYADFREMSVKDFYAALRRGEIASTAAINRIYWGEEIEKHLSVGTDVLVMPFSKGLSTSHENALAAADELRSKYPDRKLEVVDTLSVTGGLILQLKMASDYRAAGLDPLEVKERLEREALSICHHFTVQDLGHLRRGGRISATTAIVGSALGIKPMLHVNNEGTLENLAKARGRKNSLTTLIDTMGELGTNLAEQTVVIAHADCLDEAEWLAAEIKNRFDCKETVIVDIGPVIGAHTGPGMMFTAYLGTHR